MGIINFILALVVGFVFTVFGTYAYGYMTRAQGRAKDEPAVRMAGDIAFCGAIFPIAYILLVLIMGLAPLH